MTKIQILGSGCTKCDKLAETTETAAAPRTKTTL